ncbi:MAG: hypothetical protein IJ829_00635, partial [Kiritimatiellae bacterium]|nr:hypothetical protein [Kiritimatiellia bacterium]
TTSAPKATSRYAAPLPIDDERTFALPSVNWRLLALVAAAAIVLLLAALGVRALYRASMGASKPEPQAAPTATKAETKAEPEAKAETKTAAKDTRPPGDAAPSAGRKPLKPKPFYLDSDHSKEKERK